FEDYIQIAAFISPDTEWTTYNNYFDLANLQNAVGILFPIGQGLTSLLYRDYNYSRQSVSSIKTKFRIKMVTSAINGDEMVYTWKFNYQVRFIFSGGPTPFTSVTPVLLTTNSGLTTNYSDIV